VASLVVVVLYVLVLSCGQTDRITHHTDVDDRYTHVTTVGMSNYYRPRK